MFPLARIFLFARRIKAPKAENERKTSNYLLKYLFYKIRKTLLVCEFFFVEHALTTVYS